MSVCIMTPYSNSHPFEERRILVTRSEENAVKIGRSAVVRLQPATNNAIFDCKVLSRYHALLWQTNDGQFVIKDTRSSNGTFINNERLSASGEESGPKELFSGDILQLGVEIVDNTKKVASGCITCIVRLINEQGEEYAARPQGGQLHNRVHAILADYYGFEQRDDALAQFTIGLLYSSVTLAGFKAKCSKEMGSLEMPDRIIQQIWDRKIEQ